MAGRPALDGPAHQVALRGSTRSCCGASRHQVRRLRDLLPGAGAGELEDLAQQAADDALVAVLRQLGTFEGRARFTTWAYKFGVLHAGVAVRRQAWRHREVPLPDTVMVADTSPSPADLAEAAQLAHAVEAAIATSLTPHQRRVVLALLVEDVPIDVLAERLGHHPQRPLQDPARRSSPAAHRARRHRPPADTLRDRSNQ